MPQGDEAWHAIRLGKVTASRMSDMTAKTKTGNAASRDNYLAELVTELLSGTPFPSYISPAMAEGTARQPDATAEYEFERGVKVVEVDFVSHPTITRAGASPDGLVGDDGLVEIKCMQHGGHLNVLRTRKVSDGHLKQMQFQISCTSRMWCDYVAYNPLFPPPYRLWIERIYRDNDMIARLEDATRIFLAEVDQAMAELRAQYERERAA